MEACFLASSAVRLPGSLYIAELGPSDVLTWISLAVSMVSLWYARALAKEADATLKEFQKAREGFERELREMVGSLHVSIVTFEGKLTQATQVGNRTTDLIVERALSFSSQIEPAGEKNESQKNHTLETVAASICEMNLVEIKILHLLWCRKINGEDHAELSAHRASCTVDEIKQALSKLTKVGIFDARRQRIAEFIMPMLDDIMGSDSSDITGNTSQKIREQALYLVRRRK